MKYVIVLIILFFIIHLQPGLIDWLHPIHLAPNFLLAFLVSWAVIRGAQDGLWAAFAGGIMLSVSSPTPLGLGFLALAPIVPLAGLRELRLLELNVLLALPILIVETLLYFAIMLMGLSNAGDPLPISFVLTRELLPTWLGTVLVFPLVYWLTALFGRPPQAASPIWGNTWGIRS